MSDKDGLLTIGVGKSEMTVVVKPPEPVSEISLRRLGLIEAKGADQAQASPEVFGRRGLQGPEDLGPQRSGGTDKGQSPGRCVLGVVELSDISIVHLDEVFEYKAESSETQAVKFLKNGALFLRADPFQPSDLQCHRLDGRSVELGEELRGQRLLEADDQDGRLPERPEFLER
jgi:hypothetical protein